MKIAVTGSIATDHLMTFRGRFADSLVPDQLSKISLSFLAEELQIRRGGVAANISFGMAALGERPVLVGAVGEDFASYRSWLERHGVDCESVWTSETKHTARFVCTTDDDHAQIATFYAGAMGEAREIELGPVSARCGGLDLVLIGANDPEGMRRHSDDCRSRNIPFVADPSQQLAFADGPFIKELIVGAAYLMTNEYEAHLTEQKTGWSGAQILDHVGVRVITKGRDGASLLRKGHPPIEVPIAGAVHSADPTGVGDAFRAGFLCGLSWNLDLVTCAQLGSTLATYVVETVGTQEYVLGKAHFMARMSAAYGETAAAAVESKLRIQRP
ncbi:MAG: carbohydrate kinase family protein [Actinomycetota bacterium]|nr:carbohydrate kinase family protein [Actinomycetota bacterium]